MKIYGLQYVIVNGQTLFYAFTDAFLSERKPLTENDWEAFRPSFPMAGKNNSSLQGIYLTNEL